MFHQKKNKCSIKKSKSSKSSRRNNQHNSKSRSKSRSKSLSTNHSQSGGMEQACGTSNPRVMYSGANIHNTNPQASLDLDNKFMGYGGPLPLGSSIVGGAKPNIKKQRGGSKCGNEGVGTGHPKNETFKQYINNLDSQLDFKTGGGYTTDSSEIVGGMPVYKNYDDASPPALIDGKFMFGAPDQPVCGSGSVQGGGKYHKQPSKKGRKLRHKSSMSHKSNNNSRNNRNSRNSRNSIKHKNNNRTLKHQLGGDFNGFHSSKPAEFATAFNGERSVLNYPEDMSKRTFDEYQPNYTPNAI